MTKRTQNSSQLTIGMDLGDRNCEICVLGPDHRILEEASIPTSRESFADFFGRFPGARVVFEVGSQSRWVQPFLRGLGLEVLAADPRQIKLITQSRRKNDQRDAFILARAGQGLPELLCPVEHRSEEAHADLALARTRDLLVRTRTQFVNRIRALVKTTGDRIRGVGPAYFFRKAPEQVPPHLQTACAPLFAALTLIHEQLLEIERQTQRIVKERYPVVERLLDVPGVGLRTAFAFVTTLEDPRRIRGTRNCGAYLGLTPRQRESGSSSPQLGITKTGDRDLRRLLVLCGHHLLGPLGKDCRLRRWGLQLCERGGRNAKKRAVVAVARKLAIHLLAIWKNGQAYDRWRGCRAPEEAELPVSMARP